MLRSVGCVPAAPARAHCRQATTRCPLPATATCCTAAPVRSFRRVGRHTVVKVQNRQPSMPLTGSGISNLAESLVNKPFVGCNCYYLLPYAADNGRTPGHTRDKVQETLDLIKAWGFKVVRIWAFSNGPNNENIHTSPGVINFEPLTWLLDTVRDSYPDLKLMMTLTNGAPGYGGYWQYVKWAKGDYSAAGTKPNGEIMSQEEQWKDPERYDFWLRSGVETVTDRGRWTNVGPTARAFCSSYITQVVSNYRDHPCIHSWDLCNEPRRSSCPGGPSIEIGEWVHETAALVKRLDPTHPVTVGTEGFFGPSPPASLDWRYKNPFHDGTGQSNRWDEGCNWLYESQDLDFVSIHCWSDQWNSSEQPDQWLQTNKNWIDTHIDACTLLGNKPLVIQEFNMPEHGGMRDQLYQHVADRYYENNPLIGVMPWMVAHEGYGGDAYTLTPRSNELMTGSRLRRLAVT